jgi:hypothetical protein
MDLAPISDVHPSLTQRNQRRTKMNEQNRKQKGAAEFILAQLGKGCWIVGYQGRFIAGAVLSSLPAAAAYAADLAHAIGRHNFLLTVVEAGRHVA